MKFRLAKFLEAGVCFNSCSGKWNRYVKLNMFHENQELASAVVFLDSFRFDIRNYHVPFASSVEDLDRRPWRSPRPLDIEHTWGETPKATGSSNTTEGVMAVWISFIILARGSSQLTVSICQEKENGELPLPLQICGKF